jgi:RNA polymerase sigma factor (sigma-70 family)
MRNDLIAEATSHVWERLDTFNGRDGKTFSPWCRKVLRNRLIDDLRRTKREQVENSTDLRMATAEMPCESNGSGRGIAFSGVDQALDLQQPFGQGDMERIRGWKARDRLLLLALTNLWCKVPADEWDAWVHASKLPEPFPPCECAQVQEPAERVGMLAACLQMRPNTLSQFWCRKKRLLAELDYVRGLRGER